MKCTNYIWKPGKISQVELGILQRNEWSCASAQQSNNTKAQKWSSPLLLLACHNFLWEWWPGWVFTSCVAHTHSLNHLIFATNFAVITWAQVAVITLNNPSKLNALTEDMGNELTAKVGELQEKKGLRAAILTGGLCSKRLKTVKSFVCKVLGKHSVLGETWIGCWRDTGTQQRTTSVWCRYGPP